MRRIGLRIAVVAVACALVAPASAGASAQASPPTIDFGSVPVGTTSAPQTVSLLQTCTLFDSTITPVCLTTATDIFTLTPAASGDFAEVNNASSPCGALLQPVTTASVSCALDVTFTPTATGARSGTLTTGTVVLPPGPGPTVSLSGTGIPPATGGGGTDPGGGGAGSPGGGAGSAPSGSADATTAAPKKKCKKAKKRAAHASKKCRRKR